MYQDHEQKVFKPAVQTAPQIDNSQETHRIEAPDLLVLAQRLIALLDSDKPSAVKVNQILQITVGLVNGAGVFYFSAQEKLLRVQDQLLSKQVLSWAEDIPAQAKAAAELATLEGKALILPIENKNGAFILSCPVKTAKEHRCLSVLMVLGNSPPEAFMIILQLIAASLIQAERQNAAEQSGSFVESKSIIDLVHALSRTESSDLRAVMDLLKSRSGAVMIAIASVREKGKVRLEKVSDLVEVNQKTVTAQRILELMEEALSRNTWLSWPGEEGIESEPSLLLKESVQSANAKSGFIQLFQGINQEKYVVLSLFGEAGCNVREIQSQQEAGAIIGAILSTVLQRREKKTPVYNLFSTKRRLPLMLAGMILLALLFCMPVTHKVQTNCRVSPVTIRYVTARFNGMLKEAFVEPGDRVTKDERLAVMDDREIGLELSTLAASAEKSLKEKDLFMAAGDISSAQIARLEYEQIQQRMNLLRNRQQYLLLKSPVEGMILQGDLKRVEGGPVSKGQALFEIAPLDTLELELAVPDANISYVRAGLPVDVRFDAFPERIWSGTVERISPVSEIVQDKNVFVASLKITNKDGVLQPGMQGLGRIDCGKRPMIWVYFHRQWYGLKKLLFSFH